MLAVASMCDRFLVRTRLCLLGNVCDLYRWQNWVAVPPLTSATRIKLIMRYAAVSINWGSMCQEFNKAAAEFVPGQPWSTPPMGKGGKPAEDLPYFRRSQNFQGPLLKERSLKSYGTSW